MASVNKVILVGNLGADPEVRYTPNGDQVTNIRLATTDRWKDKSSGEMREATEWHRIVFYRRLAEIAGEYLKKGAQVYIEGRLRTRKWTGQDGVEKYTTEIEATELQMLGGRRDESEPRQQQPARQQTSSNPQRSSQAPASGGFQDFEDDVPFTPLGRGMTAYCY